ncbi:acetyl-CoA synthetase-like protein [Aureobasidium sp. EXF-10727]|nr:acetyl-CoA synthetase-like protein [Aureobasidium sp. EXF-10727]
MATAKHDKRLSILDGGWGAQMGPDLMFRQLEEGYDEGPDNIALICTHQSWGYLRNIVGEKPVAGCLTWTYRQLMRAARDLALAWEGYGIKRGDTVVVFLPTCAEWALGLWVATILELTFVPLDPATLAVNSAREQEYPLEQLKTSIVLVSNLRDAYNFDELYHDLTKAVKAKIVCHERVDSFFRGWINFEPPETYRLRGPGDKPYRPSPEERVVADDRVAVVLFTQENPPQGCPLTVPNIRTALVNQYILPQQRYLVTCQSSSSATLEAALVAWKRGAAIVFPEVFWRGVSPEDRTLDSVGTVMSGSLVKICSVDSRDVRVLSRGQEGRLHIGGDAMIQGYLGGSKEHFYQDANGNRWFVTSYLATMDNNGLVRLTAELKIACHGDDIRRAFDNLEEQEHVQDGHKSDPLL